MLGEECAFELGCDEGDVNEVGLVAGIFVKFAGCSANLRSSCLC